MFRNILVHIPSERPVRPVIDVAVGLTLARRAHLDAVAIGYEAISAVGMVAEGGAAAVASVMAVEQERALELANAAIAVFEVEAKLAKITYGTCAFAAIPADAEQTIGALARLYDLTVVVQPDPSSGAATRCACCQAAGNRPPVMISSSARVSRRRAARSCTATN